MRASQLLIATLKQTPADAEVVSHQLMLRAGLIRRLASGLYTWLPLGLRVLRKVEAIVREEMNRSGAQEVLMPVVQPAELWQESGRWQQYGPELLRISDRHERAFCLGPTHEEVITDLARNELRSYRQLPVNFYQIQTKFRDEIRPRFGVMRAREFIMKDAYSFHLDAGVAGPDLPRDAPRLLPHLRPHRAGLPRPSSPTPAASAAANRTNSTCSRIPAKTRSPSATAAITPPTSRRPRRWRRRRRARNPPRRARWSPRPASTPSPTSRRSSACPRRAC